MKLTQIKDFAVSISRPFADRIDAWNSQGTHTQRLLKTNLINFLCRMQNEDYLRKASSEFNSLNPFYFIFPSEITNTLDYFLFDYQFFLFN